jgi:hypothetical protein
MNEPVDGGDLEARIRVLEDREAIRDLVAAYHRWCDGGWGRLADGLVAAQPGGSRPTHDGDRVAELFVEDGVYRAVHDGPPSDHYPAAYGREEIRRLVNSWQPMPWAIHYSTNPVIRVDGDRATGEFKGLMRLSLDGFYPLHVVYRGEFVRTPVGWRIARFEWLNANDPAPTEQGG